MLTFITTSWSTGLRPALDLNWMMAAKIRLKAVTTDVLRRSSTFSVPIFGLMSAIVVIIFGDKYEWITTFIRKY